MMVGMGIINSSSERDGQDRVRMQESEVEGSWNLLHEKLVKLVVDGCVVWMEFSDGPAEVWRQNAYVGEL